MHEAVAKACSPHLSDRSANRFWQFDTSLADKVKPLKKRRYKGTRQDIARFLGREGTIERFTFRQTVPHPGHEEFSPPTQAQYSAINAFYQECCETRSQAHTMLCARDYAEDVARARKYDEGRTRFLSICTAAFILSDKNLRSVLVSWNASNRSSHYGLSRRSTYLKAHKSVTTFTSDLIDDMRGDGSEMFG